MEVAARPRKEIWMSSGICQHDLTREELEQYSDRMPGMDIDLVLCFAMSQKRMLWILSELETFFANHGLSHGRFSMLGQLFRCGPEGAINVAELARINGVSQATVSGLVDTLERDGMVERVPNPQDRRKTDIRFTEAGMRFLHRFLPWYQRMMQYALDEFVEQEREEFVSMLNRFYEGIRRFNAEFGMDTANFSEAVDHATTERN
jgi:DNA-binding MarR family transcriptional regulator